MIEACSPHEKWICWALDGKLRAQLTLACLERKSSRGFVEDVVEDFLCLERTVLALSQNLDGLSRLRKTCQQTGPRWETSVGKTQYIKVETKKGGLC